MKIIYRHYQCRYYLIGQQLKYNIYFSKIGMDHRELTQQEADKLFEQTFLRLHRENLAEKQTNKINTTRNHSYSLDLTNYSPTKSPIPAFSTPKSHTSQISSIKCQVNPEKIVLKTSHKFSTDKQSSINEMHQIDEEQPLKVSQAEYKVKRLNSLFSNESQNDIIFSNEMDIESPHKHSLLKEQSTQILYVQSQMKDIKRDLEIKFRGKLCKSQEINNKTGQVTGYKFSCKNDTSCPFDCLFQYTGNRNTKNQKLYKLILKNQNHIKNCIQQEEEVSYMKLTKTIDLMEDSIVSLLSAHNYLKPKEILSIMAERMGQSNYKFIYKGLTSKQYHKAAKKYFDNLIYKIKNQIGIL